MKNGSIKFIVSRHSFTLLELLIASSVMAILFSVVIPVFFNLVRINNFNEMTDVLYTETDYMMNRLTDEVYENTIDWPEYYNYYVLNGGGEDFSNVLGEDTFGSNYSTYAMRFFNPGMVANGLTAQGSNLADRVDSVAGVNDIGTWCQWGPNSTQVQLIDGNLCTSPVQLPSLEDTEDFATGVNPYESSFPTLPTQASSVCDLTSEMFVHVSGARRAECAGIGNQEKHEVDMLFLISPDGATKTMIGREPWYESLTAAEPSGYALSMLKMVGSDTDNDGVNETWTCAPGYLCTNDTPADTTAATDPDADDLTDISLVTGAEPSIYYDFVPISSPNISVTDLRFYIAPIEDPNKAFGEFPEKIHPYVEIYVATESLDQRASVFSEGQRSAFRAKTVSTAFEGEIQSYAP